VIDLSAVSAAVTIQPIQPIKAAKAPTGLSTAHIASAGSRGHHEAAHRRPRGNRARASRGRGGRDAADQCPRASVPADRAACSVARPAPARSLMWRGGSAQYIICAVCAAPACAPTARALGRRYSEAAHRRPTADSLHACVEGGGDAPELRPRASTGATRADS